MISTCALTYASHMRNFRPPQVVMGADRANSIVITPASARSES